MDKTKLKKILLALSILIALLLTFVFIEYGTFKTNVSKGQSDSTTVKPAKQP